MVLMINMFFWSISLSYIRGLLEPPFLPLRDGSDSTGEGEVTLVRNAAIEWARGRR